MARPLAQRLKKHYSEVVSEIMSTYYVEVLFSENVLSEEEKDELVEMKKTRASQAKRFLEIMLHKPESGIEKFFQTIKEATTQQPHIYDILYPKEEAQEEKNGQVANQNGAQAASKEKPKEKGGDLDEDLDEDAEVTDKQLDAVAKVAKDKWRQIGTNLGYVYADLQDYEDLHRRTYDRLYAILSAWKGKVDNPTVGILLEACKKAEVGGVVRKVLQTQRK